MQNFSYQVKKLEKTVLHEIKSDCPLHEPAEQEKTKNISIQVCFTAAISSMTPQMRYSIVYFKINHADNPST